MFFLFSSKFLPYFFHVCAIFYSVFDASEFNMNIWFVGKIISTFQVAISINGVFLYVTV